MATAHSGCFGGAFPLQIVTDFATAILSIGRVPLALSQSRAARIRMYKNGSVPKRRHLVKRRPPCSRGPCAGRLILCAGQAASQSDAKMAEATPWPRRRRKEGRGRARAIIIGCCSDGVCCRGAGESFQLHFSSLVQNDSIQTHIPGETQDGNAAWCLFMGSITVCRLQQGVQKVRSDRMSLETYPSDAGRSDSGVQGERSAHPSCRSQTANRRAQARHIH
jgi:hypothetical protein